MKEQFITKKFRQVSLDLISTANDIIEEYGEQGYSLTLRQLYYQFVSRDLIPNNQKSYKNLGSVINDGRLTGMIDWEAIVDRTRNVKVNSHWTNAASYVQPEGFAVDKWKDQSYRPEVWIEKEALIGVIENICEELDVPYFACKGYNSQSEQWRAGKRFQHAILRGQIPVVIHLGDHDPSGIDMTRDNKSRLSQFAWDDVEVIRIALNIDQIELYNPPPNYAKVTDSRYENYVAKYGDESWELDALEPSTLVELIETEVMDLRDENTWDASLEYEESVKQRFRDLLEDME